MNNDFLIAIVSGWIILFLFWFVSLLFIFLRRPPNSKLTLKLVMQSLLVFFGGMIFFLLLS